MSNDLHWLEGTKPSKLQNMGQNDFVSLKGRSLREESTVSDNKTEATKSSKLSRIIVWTLPLIYSTHKRLISPMEKEAEKQGAR